MAPRLYSLHNISVFFSSDSPLPVTSRVCFVKFLESESVGVSQHLTNTVFVDRALIVVPFAEGGCHCIVVSLVRLTLKMHHNVQVLLIELQTKTFFLTKQFQLSFTVLGISKVCEKEMFICVHVLQSSCKLLSLLFVLWFSQCTSHLQRAPSLLAEIGPLLPSGDQKK